MIWTEERIERLETLWRDGHNTKSIAAEFGVTKNSIIGKVNRLGLSFQQGTNADGARNATKKERIKMPALLPLDKYDFRGVRPEKARRIHELIIAGCDAPEIGEDIGLSASIVRNLLVKMRRSGAIWATLGQIDHHRHREAKRSQVAHIAKVNAPIESLFDVGDMSGFIPIVGLQPHHCRWRMSLGGDEIATFCGAQIDSGSYCFAHGRLAYQPRQETARKPSNAAYVRPRAEAF
jgi:hypothetical protein